MEEHAFLSQLNEPLAANGNRPGVLLDRGENDHNLFEHWATAQANGRIVIIGEQMEMGFRPIRTFVPKNYVEYTCPAGCRDGHAFTRVRLRGTLENCPRCSAERRRYEVQDGKPISLTISEPAIS